MKIVNGYICDCMSDARLAKKGIDPENPRNDPVRAQELEQKRNPQPKSEEARTDRPDVLRVTAISAATGLQEFLAVGRNERAALNDPALGQRVDRIA